MNPPQHYLISSVAMLVAAAQLLPSLAADDEAVAGGRPKTVRDLIVGIGEQPAKSEQLKLIIEGKTVSLTVRKDLGSLPVETRIDLRYDKAGNRIRVVNDSVFSDGAKQQLTTYADRDRAVIWTKGRSDEDGLRVRPVEPTLTLPNPWSLPAKLSFPGLFADSLHGFQALGREFSRSSPINREPDESGLLWFELKPSATAGIVMRNEFNDGLKAKAGFAAEGGWLKELEVTYTKPAAVQRLRVVEISTALSEADLAEFGFPDEVKEAVTKLREERLTRDAAPPVTGRPPSLGVSPGKAPAKKNKQGE